MFSQIKGYFADFSRKQRLWVYRTPRKGLKSWYGIFSLDKEKWSVLLSPLLFVLLIWKMVDLRIFQRFRLVKFIEKFKTCVKNLKFEKIIAFDKYLLELFFAFYFHLSKNLFLTFKIMKLLIWLTSLQNAAVLKVFKNNVTVDCRQTFLKCFWNSKLRWK